MKNDFIIIAHRGESYDAPENTLASINLAWQRNADGVEIDVQLTRDNKIVAIHDKTTLRTGRVYRRIASSNYELLQNIDVGKFKGSKYKNEKIPLLDDVIDTIPDGKVLFVEIKCGKEIIKLLIELMERKNIDTSKIRFISFDFTTIKSIKKNFPDCESYWIIEGKQYKQREKLINSVEKCLKANLDGLDVQSTKYLNSEVIQYIKSNDLKIYTWTVDDPVRAKQLYLDGIDGITTNRASWLKHQLAEITRNNMQLKND